MPSLALFDFDGTLTTRDSFRDFLFSSFGRRRVALAASKTVLASIRSFRRDRGFLKETMLRSLLGGMPYDFYLSMAKKYADTKIEKIIRPAALEIFSKHLSRKDSVYIVTASMREWVASWAERHGKEIVVIGTELEVDGGILTGRLATPNCRGAEKVARIRKTVDLGLYSEIYAYGDSRGDHEMLALADHPVYRWRKVPEI
ncbi:haloacid dehalogenase [Synergistales bacterium]|nr:haloacid dehalogenase [Synergistales bacterium]